MLLQLLAAGEKQVSVKVDTVTLRIDDVDFDTGCPKAKRPVSDIAGHHIDFIRDEVCIVKCLSNFLKMAFVEIGFRQQGTNLGIVLTHHIVHDAFAGHFVRADDAGSMFAEQH